MKNIILICLLIFYSINIFSDETNDKKKTPMKFRGNIQFGFGYYPPSYQGETNDHTGRFFPEKKDYTNSGDPNNKYHNDGSGRIIGGPGGVEAGIFSQFSMIAPFMTSKNPLFEGNNIRLNLNSKITPVSMGTELDFIITPIAFYYFTMSAFLNGGWGIPGAGNGLSRNINGKPEGYNFTRPFVEISFVNTLQFVIYHI